MGYKPKVTVVGAGFVGATTAQRLVEKEIANVVLIDIVEGLAQGKALDMMESASIERFLTRITGTTHYADTRGSDVVVITAGLARKPGMSRDDLLLKNAEILSSVVLECIQYSPDTILLVVTNPLDVMTYLAWKKSGFPSERVLGMAGALDAARYAYFIAEELKCDPSDVEAMVLGGHGDAMVPVPGQTKVKGISLTDLLEIDKIEAIHQKTRDGGAEIVKYLKTGSAYYAPSSSVVQMVNAIVYDLGEVIPSCVYLKGEYGIKDVYCGVPARLGSKGVREVVEIPLTDQEITALRKSAEEVRQNCLRLGL
ncbi:MAG: malate dehydrogenase [Candidatus Omnitrophica bacterium]|nr:malate dehydrogenase [Candidatus Omnitrophota bacterium]